jgi:hypothetical protein
MKKKTQSKKSFMLTKNMFRAICLILALIVLVLAGLFLKQRFFEKEAPETNPIDWLQSLVTPSVTDFGDSVSYKEPVTEISPEVAKDFKMAEIKNLDAMQKAYGVKFSSAELKALDAQKFVMKSILDTSIRPSGGQDNAREFSQLYQTTMGSRDYKSRTLANAQFYSTDVFLNSYANLFTELLKEMENTVFYPSMKNLSKQLFVASQKHLETATTEKEKQTWTEVRNYFAVPHVLFETAALPLTEKDYVGPDGTMLVPEKVLFDWKEKDAKVDTLDQATVFAQTLKLDANSEASVLADLKRVFAAEGKGKPEILKNAYIDYTATSGVDFNVDFTQFTPRATYTSSSLRREYFRGMKWYIMLPFFVKSPQLTTDAYAISQLLAENTQAQQDYNKLESAINFMVGSSDDLTPTDYLAALAVAKDAPDKEAAALQYLIKLPDPKIKDLAAEYQAVGVENSDEVRLKTKGLRFFSGKFIIDSYWTGFLTQGDEAVRPGYTQKLPPMASMLEVMSLLGSDYAKTQIPKLDFYKDTNKDAINQAMAELEKQNATLTEADWQENLYTSWMWTIQGLFGWKKTNHAALPQFMQSPNWAVKTLQTAAAFWTELRHATILYAKQSFAELGGGGGGCDPREVPEAPKGYIEPNIQTYARLSYLAKRTNQGLRDRGYTLKNMLPLQKYVDMMDLVTDYSVKELKNTSLKEDVKKTTTPDPDKPGEMCVRYDIEGANDWETLRVGLTDALLNSIPVPVEGPLLPAKDRRAAIVADVHTGGDSQFPLSVLYEGEGVPYVMFVAVKDANGPRLTVGFVSSHFEFTKPYGDQRLTDEVWQKNFYEGDEPYEAFNYIPKNKWPKINAWFEPLLVK